MRLLFELRPPQCDLDNSRILARQAARAIVLNGQNILLLYTKYYNDFSLPGGGVEPHEELSEGLKRELAEETGAADIQITKEFGYIDEVRLHHKPHYDFLHMLSYCFVCNIHSVLGQQKLEHYEIANGMEVCWMNIHEAIAHNRRVISAKEKSMGLSIERETRTLELITQDLL